MSANSEILSTTTMFERRYFVLAPDFHGATLLSKLLNAHPGIVSLGDTYPTNRFDQGCGCGQPVRVCPFWANVVQSIGADRCFISSSLLPSYPAVLGKADRFIYHALSVPQLAQLLRPDVKREFVTDYDNYLGAVYASAGKSRAAVFVDGVKSLARVKAMCAMGQPVDGVIHLVRDVGNYARSVQIQKKRGRVSVVSSAVGWRLYHDIAKTFDTWLPYLELTYDELTNETDISLHQLFKFMQVSPLGLDSLRPHFPDCWHFIGSASLLSFDGRIVGRSHNLTRTEQVVARILSGQWNKR